MSLTERFGLRRQNGETLDKQLFSLPIFEKVLKHPSEPRYKTALAACLSLIEIAMPLTSRHYEAGGSYLRSILPLSVDLFTANSLVINAFISSDHLSSATIMSFAAIITKSGGSHMLINFLQNNFSRNRRPNIPL